MTMHRYHVVEETPITYQADKASLNAHPVPTWFQDAKFGVFIHWGLYSVPGFAPEGTFSDLLRTDYERAIVLNPYAEQYWNAIKDPRTPSAEFHRTHYGSMPYQGFREMFLEGLKQWDPSDWARSFRNAGARYVMLVAKHHDGFCLWPTEVTNPHEPSWFSTRDIVGDLAEAVRGEGMRFGVYYSRGSTGRFDPEWCVRSGSTPTPHRAGPIRAYADAQVRELIRRYRPSVLWSDIAWPTRLDGLFRLFADYYNAVPDGVVNDRWRHASLVRRIRRLKPARAAFDALVKQAIKRRPDAFSGGQPSAVPHSDFRTVEYGTVPDIQAKKWEMTRGMGGSFGYNRNELEEDYAAFETLLSEFVDAVAKNGNLLLNVGPRGEDAQIPAEQASLLSRFGAWLDRNSEAVFGTRPWAGAEATTDTGDPVRFTTKEDTLYVTVLGRPTGSRIRIKGLEVDGKAKLLVDGSPVTAERRGDGTAFSFNRPLEGSFAPTLVVREAMPSA
jgi:alpha-L-fucosidase